jgi:hypothetical protein
VREPANWQRARVKQAAAVKRLAKNWSARRPSVCARQLIYYEQESKMAAAQSERWTSTLCYEVASLVNSPGTWFDAFRKANGPAEFVAPFLEQAVRRRKRGWSSKLKTAFDQPALRGNAIAIVLTMLNPPADLLSEVLASLSGFEHLIEGLCIRGSIAEDRVKLLLRSKHPAIARAAAVGEWHAQPEGCVRESVAAEWRDAIVRAVDDYYGLDGMFRADPSLPYDWLRHRLRSRSDVLAHNRGVQLATSELTSERRCRLIRQIPAQFGHGDILSLVVGADIGAYRELVGTPRLARLHLAPLRGEINVAFAEKALAALDAGYTPERIASAVHGGAYSWSGSESNMWGKWVEGFERLCSHSDSRIRAVGRVGRDRALAAKERALHEEQRAAVFGFPR